MIWGGHTHPDRGPVGVKEQSYSGPQLRLEACRRRPHCGPGQHGGQGGCQEPGAPGVLTEEGALFHGPSCAVGSHRNASYLCKLDSLPRPWGRPQEPHPWAPGAAAVPPRHFPLPKAILNSEALGSRAKNTSKGLWECCPRLFQWFSAASGSLHAARAGAPISALPGPPWCPLGPSCPSQGLWCLTAVASSVPGRRHGLRVLDPSLSSWGNWL